MNDYDEYTKPPVLAIALIMTGQGLIWLVIGFLIGQGFVGA